MAAQPAAQHGRDVSTRGDSATDEHSGRFDSFRQDKAFAEVHLPGYDLNRARAKAQRRKPPAAPSPAARQPTSPDLPVTFGSEASATRPPQPDSDNTSFEIEL